MTSLLKKWTRGLASILAVLLLCMGAEALAADADVLYQQPLRPYPFQPVVPINIGGKNYSFMLDTGTYGSIFDPSLRGLLGAVAQKGILSSFGTQTETDFYNAPRMILGRLKMPEWVAPTQDCAAHRRLSGVDIRGLMGIHPIDDCSVWLDFDHELLKIVKDMTAVPKGMLPLDLQHFDEGQIPKMELELAGQKILFITDTGFNGSIGLQHDVFTKFVANGTIEKSASSQAEVLQGAGGEKAANGFFKRGTLLGVDLKNVDVHDSRSVSNLGMSFLLNFNLILDLAGKRLYYERRNALPPLAYEKMIGAIILFPDGGSNVVHRVFQRNSAARDAEIREGDHIARMGALADTDMTAVTLYELCLHHPNEIMEVEVVRPGHDPTVTHMLMPRKQYTFPVPAGQ